MFFFKLFGTVWTDFGRQDLHGDWPCEAMDFDDPSTTHCSKISMSQGRVCMYACMDVCMLCYVMFCYVLLGYVRLCYVVSVCTYVRMYVCTYVRTYVHTYIRTYVCMYVCMLCMLCMYVRTYVRTYVCM